jgi:hypothetical protein
MMMMASARGEGIVVGDDAAREGDRGLGETVRDVRGGRRAETPRRGAERAPEHRARPRGGGVEADAVVARGARRSDDGRLGRFDDALSTG